MEDTNAIPAEVMNRIFSRNTLLGSAQGIAPNGTDPSQVNNPAVEQNPIQSLFHPTLAPHPAFTPSYNAMNAYQQANMNPPVPTEPSRWNKVLGLIAGLGAGSSPATSNYGGEVPTGFRGNPLVARDVARQITNDKYYQDVNQHEQNLNRLRDAMNQEHERNVMGERINNAETKANQQINQFNLKSQMDATNADLKRQQIDNAAQRARNEEDIKRAKLDSQAQIEANRLEQKKLLQETQLQHQKEQEALKEKHQKELEAIRQAGANSRNAATNQTKIETKPEAKQLNPKQQEDAEKAHMNNWLAQMKNDPKFNQFIKFDPKHPNQLTIPEDSVFNGLFGGPGNKDLAAFRKSYQDELVRFRNSSTSTKTGKLVPPPNSATVNQTPVK